MKLRSQKKKKKTYETSSINIIIQVNKIDS